MKNFGMQDFSLRRFDPERDIQILDEITNLLHRAYRPLLDQGLRYLATHQSSDITLNRLNNGEAYLGFFGTELVATITLVPPPHKDDCSWYKRLDVFKFTQFAVSPDQQKSGVGSKIMERIEARAAALGGKELALDTSEHASQLISMYKKRGYREVDTANWDVTNYMSVILSKTL